MIGQEFSGVDGSLHPKSHALLIKTFGRAGGAGVTMVIVGYYRQTPLAPGNVTEPGLSSSRIPILGLFYPRRRDSDLSFGDSSNSQIPRQAYSIVPTISITRD